MTQLPSSESSTSMASSEQESPDQLRKKQSCPDDAISWRAADTLSPELVSGLYPQFIMLGDSITQFGADEIQLSLDELTYHLQPALQKYYIRRLDIVNRGFSGYTSSMAVSTVPHFLPPNYPAPNPGSPTSFIPPIKLMTIFYGANDACLPGNPQHVTLEEYISSLQKLATYPVLRAHKTKIIIITPPPVNEYQLGKPLTRKAQNTARYAQAARSVAENLQIPCVDIWSAFMRECGYTDRNNYSNSNNKYIDINIPGSIDRPPNPILPTLLVDGLHLTGKGYKILFDELVRTIETQIPECAADNLPFVIRLWKQCFGIE